MNFVRLVAPSRPGALLLLATLGLACRPGTSEPIESPEDPVALPDSVEPELDPGRMYADLEYLSSDELRGRFTFSDELGVAADYLAKHYTKMGLSPVGDTYRVPFTAPHGSRPGDAVTIWVEDGHGGSRQVAGKEIVTLSNGGGEAAYAEAIGLPALKSARANKVKGKIVLAPSPPPDRRNEAIQALVEHEPAGVVLLGELPAPSGEAAREVLGELPFPVAWVSYESAREWMGLTASKGKGIAVPDGAKLSMAAKREDVRKESFNVLAVLPGETKPEEIVILGAHYDHIGTSDGGMMCREKDGDGICNGADDNGSGTAMVLEIARSFAEANYHPARTVVFAHFAGEELGLHGSRALADTPPAAAPFEGGEVVAMVNLDMVGRLGEDGLAIGGISSSDAWMPLLEKAQPDDVTIVYERAVNSRSDHANFYRKKIPVLFFFTGIHDDYHQASDHFDKINREGMAAIGRMVSDVTRQLADGADVTYTEPRNDDEGVVSRMPGSKESTVEGRTGPQPDAPAKD